MLQPIWRFISAPLGAEETAFSALAQIDRKVEQCQCADAVVEVLDRAKPDLCARLRLRFGFPVAEGLTLKILNLFLARYQFQARCASLLSRPFGLVVDPSNACRLACPGCVHSARNEALHVFDWPKVTLSAERFSALLQRYGPYAIGVEFSNYGEPLLNLNTPNLIRLAKTYLLRTGLSTSLSVQRFDAEAYAASGLDTMALSIDGATQPTYERFRRNGDLELVFSNIRKLVDAKKAVGKRTPVVIWKYLAFEHNVHEIPLAIRMARKLGVNQFLVANPFEVRWDDPAMRPAAIKAKARRLDWPSPTRQASNWNPFPDCVDGDAITKAFANPWNGQAVDRSAPSSAHTCHWLYKNIVMDAAGRILPCCAAPGPEVDLVFGMFDGRGADPFNSEKYRQARSWFAGEALPTTRPPHCARCEWNQTNVNIGARDIRSYFWSADRVFFDFQSLRILSGW